MLDLRWKSASISKSWKVAVTSVIALIVIANLVRLRLMPHH